MKTTLSFFIALTSMAIAGCESVVVLKNAAEKKALIDKVAYLSVDRLCTDYPALEKLSIAGSCHKIFQPYVMRCNKRQMQSLNQGLTKHRMINQTQVIIEDQVVTYKYCLVDYLRQARIGKKSILFLLSGKARPWDRNIREN